MRLIVAATLLSTWALPAVAQQGEPTTIAQGPEIEVYLAENALQAMYTTELEVGEIGMNEIRAGFLFSEERDLILTGEMLVDVGQRPERPRWMLDVGPRVYGALLNIENQDVFAIAFGGRLTYLFRRNGTTTMSVAAFYAPDIITFGNANNVIDTSIRFETQLTQATRIFLGYRRFEFDLLGTTRRIDDNVHIGFRRHF